MRTKYLFVMSILLVFQIESFFLPQKIKLCSRIIRVCTTILLMRLLLRVYTVFSLTDAFRTFQLDESHGSGGKAALTTAWTGCSSLLALVHS